MMMIREIFVLIFLLTASTGSKTTSDDLTEWLSNLNVSLPDISMSLLGKEIGTKNLTCSGFELDIVSSVSESTQLDASLTSLGARCEGGLTMGEKHGGVKLYIVDTSSIDVGLELEGTTSAKSTACSSKLKLEASFSGDLSLTLNLLWPLARGEVESLVGTKLCDTWKSVVETNITAVMNQIDEMLAPHEQPSPDFPPPSLPSGQEYVVWHELALVEAADCFGAETLVKAIDAAAYLLTGGTGEVTISAKALNQSLNMSIPNLVNLTASLETLTIGGLDTLSEVTLYPVSGTGSYEQILGSFIRAETFKIGAGADITVSPLNITLSDSILSKTLNLALVVANGEIDTKTVIAISETFLRTLEPSQFLEPGCLVESLEMWNFTKLAFNASDLSAQTSMIPKDKTSESLITFLNNGIQVFSNAYVHDIVIASSNIVDTQIRVVVDTIVMQALESLNTTLKCEKPLQRLSSSSSKKSFDKNTKVVGTLEEMLRDLRVVPENQGLALSGTCGGDYYQGTPELVVNLTDLSLSNLSLSQIESDLFKSSNNDESFHVKLGSIGASVEVSWSARIFDFQGNKTMTTGTVSLWLEASAEMQLLLSGDDTPTISMSSCNLGLEDLYINELKTKMFPNVDVSLLNSAAGILAQMIGAQIGPKICTSLTALVSSKGNPIVQTVQQLLQGLDSLPLPPNDPPVLPHSDDYYVNWNEEKLLNTVLSKITDDELVTTINVAMSKVLNDATIDLPLPEAQTISVPLGQGGFVNLTVNGLNAGGLDTFTRLHFGPNKDKKSPVQSLVTSLGMSSARLGLDLELSLTLPDTTGNGSIALSAPGLSNQAKAGLVVNDFEIDLDIFAAVSKNGLSNLTLGQYVELGCWVESTDSLNITSMMLNMTGVMEPVLIDTNPRSELETALGNMLSNTVGFVDQFFEIEIGLALRYLTDTLVREKVNDFVAETFQTHNFTCVPQDPPQDLLTLLETPSGRSASIINIVLITGISTLVIVLLALFANRFVVPKKDVDHALPMPDDATHTPLNVWGLPDKMQGVPKSMTLYMRVRKWLPLAMSFPLREGWTGYFIRVLFPIVIGLCVALRITSLIINVMNVDVQLFEEDTKQWEHRVVSFAFKTLLVDFWESKAEILAVFIFISSALVPISSILMMLVMWLFPFNPKWRGRIFKFSDIQSKFTFVSEVFLVLVLVTFASIDVTIGTTRVRMRPQAGKAIVTGLVGTMVVKLASHFLMTMHNFRLGRGKPSMLLVRQFFGADASSHDSVDARLRPDSLLRSRPSLIRQPLGNYSKWVRGTVMLCLLAVPTFFAGLITSPLLVTHYEGLVGQVMGDFDVSQNSHVYLTDLVTKLVPNTDTKGIAAFMAVSMALIMIVFPILNWIVVCVLWLVPIKNNRTLVHLAALARILYGWNALDALFFALFVTKLELHLVGNWILNDRVPEVCGAVSTNLGEECLELSVSYLTGFWLLIATLVAFIPLMILTFFYEDNLIRRRDRDNHVEDEDEKESAVGIQSASPSPGIDGDLRDPLLRTNSVRTNSLVDDTGFDSASSK